jgi:hypothetical protein
MPQGMQIYRADASLMIDLNTRLGRILVIEPWNTSPITSNAWYTVYTPVNGLRLWATLIQQFPIDLTTYYGKTGGTVEVDAVNRPGQLFCPIGKAVTGFLIAYGIY